MRTLHDISRVDLAYDDVFLAPSRSGVASRSLVDLSSRDGSGTTVPIVASNMTAVSGRRMAETIARRGGIAVIPQDIPVDVVTDVIASVKQRHVVYDTPVVLRPTDTVSDALALLPKRAHGAGVVVEQGRPVGIVTEADCAGVDRFTQLRAVMSTHLLTLPDGIDPEAAFDRLTAGNHRVAPVTDAAGRLVGVLTSRPGDLLRDADGRAYKESFGMASARAVSHRTADAPWRTSTAERLDYTYDLVATASGRRRCILDARLTEVPRSVVVETEEDGQMPRPWPMRRLVETVIEVCALEPDQVAGSDLIFTDGTIRHTLNLAKDKHNKSVFGWGVMAEDEACRERLPTAGGIGVEIWRPDRPLPGHPFRRTAWYEYPWPVTGQQLDATVVEEINRFGKPALSFVRNRADLGRILLSDDDIHRGPLWANLGASSPASGAGAARRLARVVVLARLTGDQSLEDAAMAKLAHNAERNITWQPEHPYLFRQAVADQAKQLAPHVDFDLSDLIRLRKKRYPAPTP